MVMSSVNELLKEKLTTENYSRLMALDNPKLHEFIADAIELTGAFTVSILTDSQQDKEYLRAQAIKSGEEIPLAIAGPIL